MPRYPLAKHTSFRFPTKLASLGTCNAFILERHGPVALGATLNEAFCRLEVVEHTARITVAAIAAGGAQPISEDEAARLRAMGMAAGLLRTAEALRSASGKDAGDEALIAALVERVVARLGK